jgi:hypothetical protein
MASAGLALVATSCANGERAMPPDTTAVIRSPGAPTAGTSMTTSTTTAQIAVNEIVTRYIAYWEARFAANEGTPNPDDPSLPEYATGEQLQTAIKETRANLEHGLAFRRAEDPSGIQRVPVVALDADRAVVQECVVADGVIVRRATGEIVNNDVATHSVRGELVRVDGAWKVSSTRLIQRWEGVTGCARAS